VQSWAQQSVHFYYYYLAFGGGDMPTNKDLYKLRREADEQRVRENNLLLYGFFGKQVESIREVQQRLNAQLQAHEVNKMKSEIAELNETTD
jgi:hypothetical protein